MSEGAGKKSNEKMLVGVAAFAVAIATCAFIFYRQKKERKLVRQQMEEEDFTSQRREAVQTMSRTSSTSQASRTNNHSKPSSQSEKQRKSSGSQPTNEDFENDFKMLEDALGEDLDLLGQIRVRDSDSLLSFNDWCRIHLLIKKYGDVVFWPSLRKLINIRRQLLRQSKNDQYRTIVPVVVEKEHQINDTVSNVILDHFNINFNQFKESFEYGLNMSPNAENNNEAYLKVQGQIAQMKVNLRRRDAKRNNQDELAPRTLTRDECLQIFEFQNDMQKQALPALTQTSPENLQEEYDHQDALFLDKIYLRFGIQKEDFQLAFDKYDLASDNYITSKTDEAERQIPIELTNEITGQWCGNMQAKDDQVDSQRVYSDDDASDEHQVHQSPQQQQQQQPPPYMQARDHGSMNDSGRGRSSRLLSGNSREEVNYTNESSEERKRQEIEMSAEFR